MKTNFRVFEVIENPNRNDREIIPTIKQLLLEEKAVFESKKSYNRGDEFYINSNEYKVIEISTADDGKLPISVDIFVEKL